MTWRDLATKLDEVVVHAFAEGGISLQKMASGAPQGDPIPVPAEFDSAYVDQSIQDGMTVSTTRPAAWIHYADLPDGVEIAQNDRLVVAAGPNAGTWSIDSLEPNSDNTGVMLRLKVARTSRPL